MEKLLETAWVGLKVGCGGVSGNHQGGANRVSQVDGVSDMALLGEGSKKEQWPLRALFCGRKLPPSSCPDAGQFISSLYASDVF